MSEKVIEYDAVTFLDGQKIGWKGRVSRDEARITRDGDTVTLEFGKEHGFVMKEVPRSCCILERTNLDAKARYEKELQAIAERARKVGT